MTSPNPIAIFSTIVSALKAESYTFYYGRKPDQNFGHNDDGTELVGNCCFLDPITMKSKPNKTNIDEYTVPFFILFGEMLKVDATQADKIAAQNRAIAAIREFYLRLNAYDRRVVKETGAKDIAMIEGLFDMNLCGASLQCSFVMLDASSTCIAP